jgi:hypothetical protein
MGEKVVYECGNFKNIEQVSHNGEMGFAVYEDGKFTFMKQVGHFLPKTKVPWPLAPMPIEYETEAKLLAEVRAVFVKYCDLSPHYNYDICAAWVMASWRAEKFRSVSYIEALGDKGSGKSRLLEALAALSYRGIKGPSLTVSAIFHALNDDHVTLFYDQAEKLRSFKDSGEIISILNGGYRRGDKKYLYDVDTKTYDYFDIFGFKAFATTNPLESTLEDRCIPMLMHKNTREIPIELDPNNRVFIDLRGKLLNYRFKFTTSEESDESDDSEEEYISLLRLKTEDNRLKELFAPMSYVFLSSQPSLSSQSSHPLFQAITNLESARKEADYTSFYGEIIQAIDSCVSEGDLKNGRLLLDSITTMFNITKLDARQKWTSRSVGRYLKTLGFQNEHGREGTLIIINEALLADLRSRYVKSIEKSLETYAIITGSMKNEAAVRVTGSAGSAG